MNLKFPSILLIALMVVSNAWADQAPLEFKPGSHVPTEFKLTKDMDASGIDFSGSTFSGMHLGKANFSVCTSKRQPSAICGTNQNHNNEREPLSQKSGARLVVSP